MNKILTSSMGDDIFFENESLIIHFSGLRNVVSTCNLNGGYHENLKFVFNNSCGRRLLRGEFVDMNGNNMLDHYTSLAQEELNLPAEATSGMSTAALIENSAIVTKTYAQLDVTAIATAGIDVNGGRAGDSARFNEFTREPIQIPPGTVNIFLLINANLDAGTLTRAAMTATEAKTAALQELMANSMYSEGIATGSGTDGIIVVGNLESDLHLFDAGKHCILGELIGCSVKEAVKEALDKQAGMNTQRQASVVWQNKRYGITTERIRNEYFLLFGQNNINEEALNLQIEKTISDNSIVAYIASIIHLVDQNRWGLLTNSTLQDVSLSLLNTMRGEFKLTEFEPNHEEQFNYKIVLQNIITTLAEIVS